MLRFDREQGADIMNETTADASSPHSPQPRWQPLSSIDRRVVGVLAEKAKTTPDVYPMSVNGICTGCNQKNNRSPLMQLEPDEVEESLERLRQLGAVGMVEGYGRVQKYRHYLYDWLGVDKVELAVMTELLLRGDQTVGELRGRAARMEPIADMAALKPVLDSLKAKGLIISLSPEGRGQVIAHALFKPREIESLRAKYEGAAGSEITGRESEEAPVAHTTSRVAQHGTVTNDQALEELRSRISQLRSDLDDLRASHQSVADELRVLKDSLGG
jgi:uncharacterized protein YceH (UPF0502 family)